MRQESDLFAHQRAAADLIVQNTHFGALLDMGLGKTATTLTAVSRLIYELLEIRTALVVAPKRVVESVWQQEATEWAHLQHLSFSLIAGTPKQREAALQRPADVYLISVDNFAWLCAKFGGGYLPYDMLVVDESSKFKNHASKRFKAARLVQPSFKRAVILTGTPAPNGVPDLWAQIYLLDRGKRLGKTITAFRESFLYAAKMRGHIVYQYGCSEESRIAVMDAIQNICISMKQEDYISLPEEIINVVKVDMPEDLKREYATFEREKVLELFGEGQTITVANSAALNNKLLQFANGAIYDADKNYHAVHDLKLNALADILEDAQGKPVLLSYTFKSDAARILERFKSYQPRQLGGDQDVRDWNAGKIQLMIMHPESGGHGLNLQAGGHIIVWFGNTWNLEQYQQLNRRLKRPGQKNNVIINKLVTAGTIDEEVIAAIDRKDGVQSAVMEAVKYRIDKYLKSR
jgi:SNF2 family DNA or RNA helicase